LFLFSLVDFNNNLKILSLAIIPDFIAVCTPLIFGVFKKPGLHPIKQPPGNESFGIDFSKRIIYF
jgi:hypothetical protein